ncbi:unnamed protein product [Rotaria sp. Silwood1]|nr:unnamed protein product [Rotaria sp. Silwood1]
MLRVNPQVLQAQAQLGGKDLIPFYKLLEDGREGEIYREMEDLFYYSQLRFQDINQFDRREVTRKIPLSEITFVMKAFGYYPTEQEIEEILNEVKFSTYVETNINAEHIDLNDFIKCQFIENQLPDQVTCLSQETCCETSTGLWACCPIKDGLCCDDGIHCCANGQTCLPNGQCSSSSNDINPALALKIRLNPIDSVPCPDGSSCPDDNTCCQLSSGQYGCCPLADAVCCSDHLHCCPHGYVCDVEHSRCKKKLNNLNDVPCPDGSSCPTGNTCCQLASGEYGCCPLGDHLHCCPHGYTCDVEKGQCNPGISIPWFNKNPSFHRKQKLIDLIDDKQINIYELNPSSNSNPEIICPDATSLCPSTSTCCLTPDSTWGCCPVEKAVCCSDHEHCCPQHYKCDLHIFKCDHPLFGSINMLKKEASLYKISSNLILSNDQSTISTIQCPDGKSYCPEETTCCQLKDDTYGCCPYPQASCCSDKIHCCGNGYSCDDSGKRCIRHLSSLNKTDIKPSARKLLSFKMKTNVESFSKLSPLKDQTCPDGKTICSPSSTCCPNKQNNQVTYSCCPYSKGVCCGSNGSVCCPNGYTCNQEQLSCQLSDTSILFRDVPSDTDYNRCGISDVACLDSQTCCRTYGSNDGGYACCAFADAQCCDDGKHCCPRGTRCDVQSGGCVQND